MLESVIFYPAALLLLIFAVSSIFLEKITYSLLSAVCVFFLSGLIFYLLKAEYNAVIQLAIYGLAIPILLSIALMFTNTRIEKNTIATSPRRYIAYFGIGLIFFALLYLVLISLNVFHSPLFAPIQTSINSIRVFDAITDAFLKNYIIAFELMSLLLFAVVVGVSDNAK